MDIGDSDLSYIIVVEVYRSIPRPCVRELYPRVYWNWRWALALFTSAHRGAARRAPIHNHFRATLHPLRRKEAPGEQEEVRESNDSVESGESNHSIHRFYRAQSETPPQPPHLYLSTKRWDEVWRRSVADKAWRQGVSAGTTPNPLLNLIGALKPSAIFRFRRLWDGWDVRGRRCGDKVCLGIQLPTATAYCYCRRPKSWRHRRPLTASAPTRQSGGGTGERSVSLCAGLLAGGGGRNTPPSASSAAPPSRAVRRSPEAATVETRPRRACGSLLLGSPWTGS